MECKFTAGGGRLFIPGSLSTGPQTEKLDRDVVLLIVPFLPRVSRESAGREEPEETRYCPY